LARGEAVYFLYTGEGALYWAEAGMGVGGEGEAWEKRGKRVECGRGGEGEGGGGGTVVETGMGVYN